MKGRIVSVLMMVAALFAAVVWGVPTQSPSAEVAARKPRSTDEQAF